MSTTTPDQHQQTYAVRPLDPQALKAWRRGTHPDHDVLPLVADGGEPVRCCLRDAAAGDALLLVSYSPPLPAPSPYRETGAVYVHAEPCAGPERLDRFPAAWEGRPQVLRAYDAHGRIHPATRDHRGHGTDESTHAALRTVLDEPGVVEVHTRNVAYGCFMVAVTRAAE